MSDPRRDEIERHFARWRDVVDRRDLDAMASMFAPDARGGNAVFGLFDGPEAIIGFARQHWPEAIPNRSVWHVIDGVRVVDKWRETLPGEPSSGSDYDYFGITELLYAGEGKWSYMFGLPDTVGALSRLRALARRRAGGAIRRAVRDARIARSRRGHVVKGYAPRQSFADGASARAHDHRGDESEAVDFLAARAEAGPVLELGIGTGRLALPLAERGLRVDGIDFSESMLERLREKPGADALGITLGDFASFDLPDRYALIFVAWNSFFNLLEQDAQVGCFERVARHLAPGGRFVLEAYTPSFLFEMKGGQAVEVEDLTADRVGLSVIRHDAATQRLEQDHVSLSAEGVRIVPVVQRYAWPAELDLMARLAGLACIERVEDWRGTPFSHASAAHVSVYAAKSD